METSPTPTEAASRERARSRWREARPDEGLTWARFLRGDAFVDAVSKYRKFSETDRLLEVGPGYGRLLDTLLSRETPFASYTGVEFSAHNAEYLRERFTDPRVEIHQGDVEEIELDQRFDVMISSLVLKHLYPSFEAALDAVSRHMAPGGWVFFDLLESRPLYRLLGKERYFKETDVSTFVHRYRRNEVLEILDHVGLEHEAFDQVQHDEGHRRLLVVARKPAAD